MFLKALYVDYTCLVISCVIYLTSCSVLRFKSLSRHQSVIFLDNKTDINYYNPSIKHDKMIMDLMSKDKQDDEMIMDLMSKDKQDDEMIMDLISKDKQDDKMIMDLISKDKQDDKMIMDLSKDKQDDEMIMGLISKDKQDDKMIMDLISKDKQDDKMIMDLISKDKQDLVGSLVHKVSIMKDNSSIKSNEDTKLEHNILSSNDSIDYGGCTLDLFGGDAIAYWACVTLYALQINWFPSPIAGLYWRSYLDWNGFDGFWQNGAILETIANFMHYTDSKRHSQALDLAWRTKDKLLHAYYPTPSFDDEGWYAVSFARIYEVTGNISYLNTAEDVFNWMWDNGWDSTGCGGMWFTSGHGKKITITNCQILLIAAKLYRYTKNEKYLNKSISALDFLQKRVIDPVTHSVADSILPRDVNCTALGKYNVTYNSGLLIGGLVELYKATFNDSYIKLAQNIANATIVSNSNSDGVLLEYCDWDGQCSHDDDGKMFKGIFMRNLRYLIDVLPNEKAQYYQTWIKLSINSALKNAQCLDNIQNCSVMFLDGPSGKPTHGPLFTTSWAGPYNISNVISQSSVLDLFISGINPSTKCKDSDPRCSYNSKFPDVKPLVCSDNPCPVGHSCCAWDKIYASCCMPYQTCYGGGCYP